MIFLNPSVLLGLLAASVPILIHLLNLRKLNRIEFSTLSFLKELQKTKIRKIKLKQWILLLLRVLIILLLVAAFARPTLEQITIGDSSSAAKTTAVFIIDNSYSMSVVTDDGSHLNNAKRMIKSISEILHDGDELHLVITSDINLTTTEPVTLMEFANQIPDINLSFVSGNLLVGISAASKLLNETANFNKELYIFSDFQNHEFDQNNLEKLTENHFDENVKIYTTKLNSTNISNLSLTEFKIDNQIFELNKQVDFTTTVTNYTQNIISNKIISLFVDGVRKAQNNVTLSAGESQNITFNTTIENTGLLNLFVELEDDDLVMDNKMFQGIYVPDKYPILLLEENGVETNFCKVALTKANVNNNIALTIEKIENNSALNLNNYKVILINGSSSNFNYEKYLTYLSDGGKIILFPSEKSTLNDYINFCEGFQKIPIPVRIIEFEQNNSSEIKFDDLDYDHPIFSHLFEAGSKKEVESPEMFKYFQINTMGKGKSIISLTDGTSFLSEYSIGDGKVLLFNSALSLNHSTFPLKGIFAPLLNKMISYLASETSELKEYVAGEMIDLSVSGLNIPQIEIKTPNGGSEFLSFNPQNSGNFITYSNSKLPGVYQFLSDEKLIDFAVVNYNPIESELKSLSDEELESFFQTIDFQGSHIKLSSGENLSEIIFQARFGTELWKYFLMTALLLALLEMWISKSTKKDLGELNKEN